MEGEASLEWQETEDLATAGTEQETLPRDEERKVEGGFGFPSLDAVFPDDILEKILSFLPVASIIRAASVCKRWHEVVHSGKSSWVGMVPHKPWYFMFTCGKSIAGYVYDPSLKKWHTFDFPCIDKCNWFVSSSSGLVCFMDYEDRNRLFVCNPITRDWKQLQQPPNGRSPDYSALALSVDRFSRRYTVAVAKSKQLPGDFLRWEFTIHIYESESSQWVASVCEVLVGWRGGDEGVICNGVLYCLLYSSSGSSDRRHGIVMHKLGDDSSPGSLLGSMVPAPCPLTCGRLMNLGERVVMVGGIGRQDRPDVIKGIGIWELLEEEWKEVARMPQKFFQGFGELDDVFASGGAEGLVFIQSYGAPALLVFDMGGRQWKWAMRCPVTKRFALQLFTGFCFEPRLDITC
ncbi:hypothetical protein HPP92_019587 [Vanilla planifolia]|uniref:F-box domain-containing protein n=1 Tax=Vanilla planifolia TaxID=51239 RepID=A0A835QAK8_VANPL|nr:hypothetical protein HPP92_019587 [Vanilla planifolia]